MRHKTHLNTNPDIDWLTESCESNNEWITESCESNIDWITESCESITDWITESCESLSGLHTAQTQTPSCKQTLKTQGRIHERVFRKKKISVTAIFFLFSNLIFIIKLWIFCIPKNISSEYSYLFTQVFAKDKT